MNDEQLDDLKQFIDSRISQAEAMLEGYIGDLRAEVHQLRDETHDGFAGIAEVVEEQHKTNAEFDGRLGKLEQQTAA